MKQKILAVLMIIAVLLCFMPTMAFADGEPAPNAANQIGKYYKADDQNSGALAATPSLDAGETVKKYETQKIADG